MAYHCAFSKQGFAGLMGVLMTKNAASTECIFPSLNSYPNGPWFSINATNTILDVVCDLVELG